MEKDSFNKISLKSADTFDFHIRWAWYKISRLYNNIAQDYGVNMSTGYALLKIDPKKGTPSTKLGPSMGMESRSLTRTLKVMEAEGLIYKKADAKDRRIIRIMLTDYGLEQREIAKNAVLELNSILYDNISESERESFFSTISKISEVLESELFKKRKK